jgi:hypothetical protein
MPAKPLFASEYHPDSTRSRFRAVSRWDNDPPAIAAPFEERLPGSTGGGMLKKIIAIRDVGRFVNSAAPGDTQLLTHGVMHAAGSVPL